MTSRTVYLETFGCQMNELDSELVVGRLSSLGYRFTTDARGADIVLYNTCSVRERAEQKVWSRLGEIKKAKERRPGMVVGVLGCMAERDGEGLIDRMPVVDILCGPGELDKLPVLIDNAVRTNASLLGTSAPGTSALRAESSHSAKNHLQNLGSENRGTHGLGSENRGTRIALSGNTSRRSATLAAAADSLELLDLNRSISPADATGHKKFSAYVRITRGCNKFCTYCVVPFTRGAEVHRPPDHIVDECKRLADAGIIEITLLGQTVNHYRFEHGAAVMVDGITQPQKGRAFKGGHRRDPLAGENVTTFADLLARIHDEVPAIRRLRFVTSYPRDFGDDVLEVIRDHPRICRYIHVPAQTGSDRMLDMMNRGHSIAEYDEFIERCRGYLDQPGIGRPLMLSGDIIVGFPTETDEDFEATVSLLKRTRYKNCFIFKYSPRPGTVAYDKIPDDVPDAVKRERNNRLLAVQAEISDAISREQVGREFDVLFEGLSRAERKKRGVDVKPGTGMVALTVSAADSASSGIPSNELRVQARGFSEETQDPRSLARGARLGDRIEAADTPVQLAGRTDGDLIVHVEVPGDTEADALIGTIRRVRITDGGGLSLTGELVGP
ncbi:MAG TPA: MiaB/RimO family radical SAM methylthiotransferase [Phycisphaerales bacterium]|nr:MiaB/RimO family radical SAM methylthiotransferase [Phycisphaerales bacterium]